MRSRKKEQDLLRQKQEKLRVDFQAACKRGTRAEVEPLIAAGARINEPDSNGATPLFIAVSNGNLEVTKLLIENRAAVNIKTMQGFMGLYDQYPGGSTPLLIASWKNYTDIVDVLVKKGADVKAQNFLERTALHYAAKHGNMKVVKMLVEKGADLNVPDKFGKTPESYARDNNHEDVAAFLKKAAALQKNPPPPPKNIL